jgi:thiamine-phosphate diphosphorylase
VRPLPRLHAVTDDTVLALEDFPARVAAVAAAGPAVALHARSRQLAGAGLTALVGRLLAQARPSEASVFVNGRPDIAAALGAHGVQLAATDLAPADARLVLGPSWPGWIGRSVHDSAEAAEAKDEGADFLLVGSVYETASHPGRLPAGLGLITATARLGLPVIAIGGITPARVAELKDAGAWGIAAITALWKAEDPAAAAMAMLDPWMRM